MKNKIFLCLIFILFIIHNAYNQNINNDTGYNYLISIFLQDDKIIDLYNELDNSQKLKSDTLDIYIKDDVNDKLPVVYKVKNLRIHIMRNEELFFYGIDFFLIIDKYKVKNNKIRVKLHSIQKKIKNKKYIYIKGHYIIEEKNNDMTIKKSSCIIRKSKRINKDNYKSD